MREMRIDKWCDSCYLEDEARVPAVSSFTVGIVAGETRPELKLLELCERHSKAVTELQALLGEVSHPELPPKPAAKPAPPSAAYAQRLMACPICDLEYARNGMVSHVWRAHRTDKRPNHNGRCPTCREMQVSAAGLAAHRRIAHGYDALEDALSGAKGYQA